MNPKWLALAAQMLEAVAEKYSNHGCNDWYFPHDWTDQERSEFFQAITVFDGNVEGSYPPPDFLVMEFLADRLDTLAKVTP